ncbi:hypothetical protein DdX_18450 [Ditylenchus destructor]|uniref:Uncharacterized protein n=1 Tax=Ditylenchus destructor TaxID=166010 RepID=A0AAD4MLJ9_9BILA|nr:hypothetical protein DdX_18450 [Ditylenchus destructor]
MFRNRPSWAKRLLEKANPRFQQSPCSIALKGIFNDFLQSTRMNQQSPTSVADFHPPALTNILPAYDPGTLISNMQTSHGSNRGPLLQGDPMIGSLAGAQMSPEIQWDIAGFSPDAATGGNVQQGGGNNGGHHAHGNNQNPVTSMDY